MGAPIALPEALCAACRRLVPAGAACDACGSDRVVAGSELERVIADEAGVPHDRLPYTSALLNMGLVGFGMVTIGLVTAFTAVILGDWDGFATVVGIGMAVVGGGLLGAFLRSALRAQFAPRERERMGRPGTLAGSTSITSLLRGDPCLGYSVAVIEGREHYMRLRYVEIAPCRVELDDGGHVQLRGGRIVVEPHPFGARAAVHSRTAEPRWSERLAWPGATVSALFDWGVSFERCLQPGDRVEVLGELEPVASADCSGGYRQAAMDYRAVGTPRLRLTSPGRRGRRGGRRGRRPRS